MPVTAETQLTARFIRRGFYLALLAILLVLAVFLNTRSINQTLYSKTILVAKNEPLTLTTVELAPSWLGTVKVEASALVPKNRQVTYAIQLLTPQGQLLHSTPQHAERRNQKGSLDTRSVGFTQATASIAIAVLNYTDATGNELQQPIFLRVNIRKIELDSRYLWFGCLGIASLGIISLATHKFSPTITAIRTSAANNAIEGRGVLGGPKQLVRVNLKLISNQKPTRRIEVTWCIVNEVGEIIYDSTLPVTLKFNPKKALAIAKLERYFILSERGIYQFYVIAPPYEQIQRTILIVRDRARTFGPVKVKRIKWQRNQQEE